MLAESRCSSNSDRFAGAGGTGSLAGSAAASLEAAKEAILKCLQDEALTQAQLFEKAAIPTKTTGQRAVKELLSTDRIKRIG